MRRPRAHKLPIVTDYVVSCCSSSWRQLKRRLKRQLKRKRKCLFSGTVVTSVPATTGYESTPWVNVKIRVILCVPCPRRLKSSAGNGLLPVSIASAVYEQYMNRGCCHPWLFYPLLYRVLGSSNSIPPLVDARASSLTASRWIKASPRARFLKMTAAIYRQPLYICIHRPSRMWKIDQCLELSSYT